MKAYKIIQNPNRKISFKKILLFVGLCMFLQYGYAQIPSLNLKTIYGKTINTNDLSKSGKPIVISFFATYCKPCLRELSAINEVYSDWQQETGVELVAVSIDEAQNSSKVKTLVDGYNWTYTVLLDPNGELKRALGVNLIPSVFVIDSEGNIRYKKSGYTDGSEDELLKQIKLAQTESSK